MKRVEELEAEIQRLQGLVDKGKLIDGRYIAQIQSELDQIMERERKKQVKLLAALHQWWSLAR